MDAFQRKEAKRLLLARRIIPVWVEIRTLVGTLLASYNETRTGKTYPAAIESESDLYIIVSSARGMAPDNYHTILITVRFAVEENDFVIVVTKERWLTRGSDSAKVRRDSVTRQDFTLDGDIENNNVWLVSKEQAAHFTPVECVESVLEASLSPTKGPPD